MAVTELFIGFDSAWADNPKAPGAICALLVSENGQQNFHPPCLVGFDAAQAFIEKTGASSRYVLVAIDQPLIVNNPQGKRPCERVASAVLGRMQSAVQPANTEGSGKRFFGPDSGIRRFLARLQLSLAPNEARQSNNGCYAIEVFPALAMATIAHQTWERRRAAKYNPSRKKTFNLEDWGLVCRSARQWAADRELVQVAHWLDSAANIEEPRKADQDRLDAVICLLIAYVWRHDLADTCVAIGTEDEGCIVTPWSPDLRPIMEATGIARGVTLTSPA